MTIVNKSKPRPARPSRPLRPSLKDLWKTVLQNRTRLGVWSVSLLTGTMGLVNLWSSVFPGDPIRTLDALHLASLLFARSAVAGLRLLSLDERVRQAAKGLGVAVEPA